MQLQRDVHLETSPGDSQVKIFRIEIAALILVRRLRTRPTTLAQRARLVVIQDGGTSTSRMLFQLSAQFATASALSDSQMTTPRPRARMPAANLFDAAASVCSILLRRHLDELRIPFVNLPWWNCQVIMNFILVFRVVYICVLNCLTA